MLLKKLDKWNESLEVSRLGYRDVEDSNNLRKSRSQWVGDIIPKRVEGKK